MTQESSHGIGDGGNELGFGSIHDQVAKEIPKGEEAKGGGIVPVTPVDVLVPAAVMATAIPLTLPPTCGM